MDFSQVASNALRDGIVARELTLKNQLENLVQIGKVCSDAIESGCKVLLCGNGGSAADAQHLAAELLIRLRPNLTRQTLPALALAMDSSTLTACGNDLGFEAIFERMVEAFGKRGDVLIAITTSGKSPNVLRALKKAKEAGYHGICRRSPASRKARVVAVALALVEVERPHFYSAVRRGLYGSYAGLI